MSHNSDVGQHTAWGCLQVCVPDLHRVFMYAVRAVTGMGLLVDNWANIAHMLVLSFFLDRDTDSMQSCKVSDLSMVTLLNDDVRGFLAKSETRTIPVSESLLAITDGSRVVYFDTRNGKELLRTSNAFGMRGVDVEFGVSSIDF